MSYRNIKGERPLAVDGFIRWHVDRLQVIAAAVEPCRQLHHSAAGLNGSRITQVLRSLKSSLEANGSRSYHAQWELLSA